MNTNGEQKKLSGKAMIGLLAVLGVVGVGVAYLTVSHVLADETSTNSAGVASTNAPATNAPVTVDAAPAAIPSAPPAPAAAPTLAPVPPPGNGNNPTSESTSTVSSVGASGVSPTDAPSSGASTPGNNAPAGTSVSSAAGTPAPVVSNNTGGKLPVTFALIFTNIYDDNIYIRHRNVVGDFFWEISPDVDYKSSDYYKDGDWDEQPENYFHLGYNPTFTEFLDATQNNSIDHNAQANYVLTLKRLRVGVDEAFVTTHYPNVDFGGRLTADYYRSRLYADYQVSRRLLLGVETTSDLSRYEQGINTNEFTASLHLDYALYPRTTIGIGTTAGYLAVADGNPDEYYDQFHLRASYVVTDKINAVGKVGFEYRGYDGGASTVTPVFGLSINYQLSDSTLIQLNARRASVPSISRELENYYSSSVGFTVRDRLANHLVLELDANYENDSYYSVTTGRGTGLTFDYFVVRPTVEWDWNDYLRTAIYYERDQNISSDSSEAFSVDSIGLRFRFAY